MEFRILGLAPEPFLHLYGLPDADLAGRGARRYRVDEQPGFPDRIELEDVAIGGSVLLVNYDHQPAITPYRASHAIFVREGAERAYDSVNEVPQPLRRRMISLRAFGPDHWMHDAALVDGSELEVAIERLLLMREVAYLQAHYAVRGCYAARVERV